jgi:hypothetical protein
MPPWHAEPGIGRFENDRRLTPAEIDTIARWADNGAPEGDPKKAPPPLTFLEGWNIGQPDKVFEMPEPFDVPAEGSIDYQWIVLPTGLDKDSWIEGVEVRPGDRSVVHHVIAFYRKPGSKWLADAKPGVPTPKGGGDSEAGMSDGAIGGYVPGLPATRLRPGRAVLLPAGSDIVLQVHYNATGKAARDRTKVGIVFARHEVVERSFQLGVASANFVIPPGEANYRVDADLTVDTDVRVVGFTPHMHLRGKSFESRAVLGQSVQSGSQGIRPLRRPDLGRDDGRLRQPCNQTRSRSDEVDPDPAEADNRRAVTNSSGPGRNEAPLPVPCSRENLANQDRRRRRSLRVSRRGRMLRARHAQHSSLSKSLPTPSNGSILPPD